MNTHEGNSGALTLLDAVEALTSIMESHWETEEQALPFIDDETVKWKDSSWLKSDDKEEVEARIKAIFKVIYRHLKNFAENRIEAIEESNSLEKIKSIMVLVGEAAKKIDRFGRVFKEQHRSSVTAFREYKLLQEFYKKKISHHIGEAELGKWILALSLRAFEQQKTKDTEKHRALQTTHVFVDLDSVKKDTEHELFFIRKQDGSRFYSPALVRNIKLVSDFGSHIGKELEKDPLGDYILWQDKWAKTEASEILSYSKGTIDRYLKTIRKSNKGEVFYHLSHAIFALILASNDSRLIMNGSTKGCFDYFGDFQMFLRLTLQDRAFRQMIAYPLEEKDESLMACKKIIERILEALFMKCQTRTSLSTYLNFLINEGNDLISYEHRREALKSGKISSRLACDFSAMQKLLRQHSSGPLNRVLMVLEDGEEKCYDPYLQKLLPERLFSEMLFNQTVTFHRLPAPIVQEFIHEAKISEEFRTFLHTYPKDEGKILMINFQDRTSWKEHARADTLEKLQKDEPYSSFLNVITFPKDTEFYHQDPPYHEDHQVALFKEHLIEHVLSDYTGYYFPKELKLKKEIVIEIFDRVHAKFFSRKNVLTRESRLDFIEIFNLMLMMKCIQMTNARHVFFTCKDGVDVSSAEAALLLVYMRLMKGDGFSQEMIEQVQELIYLPALMGRERSMMQSCFQRMLGAVKVMEHVL